MLIVVQFPFFDGRAFELNALGRLARPNWPPVYGIPRQFVRRFGPAKRRRDTSDALYTDESAFMGARCAIGFPNLTSMSIGEGPNAFRPEGAFRRLLCDATRTVARVEVGLRHRRKGRFVGQLDEKASGDLIENVLKMPTVVPKRKDGQVRRLDNQGRPLARVYADATTAWKAGVPARPPFDLIEVGQPMAIVQFDYGERWEMPSWMEPVAPKSVAGAKLGFGRVGTGQVATWFVGPEKEQEDELLRSLRICLLRLHARQEALDGLIWQLRNGRVQFVPYSKAGDDLSEYLKLACREIAKPISDKKFERSALVAAMDAAISVGPPGAGAAQLEALDQARAQIRANVEAYLARREAEREVKVYKKGVIVTEQKIINSVINNSNVMAAGRIENVRISMNNSAARDEVKAAVTDLTTQATNLTEQLPDDQSKSDVAAAVETIGQEAAKANPTEFLVRAAGEALVKAGEKVQEFAAPIATAVNTVLKVLGFAA